MEADVVLSAIGFQCQLLLTPHRIDFHQAQEDEIIVFKFNINN